MGKLIFAAVLFLVGMAVSRALARAATAGGPQWQRVAGSLHLASRGALALGIVIPALIVLLSTFKVIPAGHVGVATLFGQVQPTPLPEGLNFINPLLDVTQMSTQVQRRTGRYDAASKDLQAVHVEMVLNYRLIPERAPEVYQKIGVNYESVIIDPAAQEVLKANTALHNAAEILQKRQVIKSDVQKDITTWLVKYGVEMKEAALANIRFDPAYEKAIEAKQIEEQKAEQKRYELIQAQRQAEIAAATAKGKGDAAREEAKGVADALRIKGEAEAAYNTKVASSLTPVLIQQQYLARWDGRLPQYTLGGNVVPFIQIPGAAAGESPRR
ncbi:MAG TPA: prohibitin family protein [Methylomirabilota bacterium]|nr:prohibitin family protein [Methylomirabilota bacterium]